MRILFVIHGFLPFSSTGVETYTYTLAKALSRKNDVLVYTARFDPLKKKYSDFDYTYSGIKVRGFYYDSVYKNLSETYRDRKLDEKFAEIVREFRPDIVHFQHLIFHSAGYTETTSDLKIPSLLTLHDFYYFCPNLGQRLFLGRYRCRNKIPLKCAICYRTSKLNISPVDTKIYKQTEGNFLFERIRDSLPHLSYLVKGLRLLRIHPTPDEMLEREREMLKFLGRINLLISPSLYYKNFYEGYTGHSNIIHLDYGFEKAGKYRKKKKQSSKLRLGFAGTISRHKGVHLLIELAERLKDSVRILIWGNDKNDLILAKRLKSQRNIEFRGEFGPEDKGRIYGEIDYLVVPSVWEENSPLVIHEALLYGTPVIASRRGGNPELIREGRNGFLFDPDERDSLTNLIKKILQEKIRIEKPDSSVVMNISRHREVIERLYANLLSNK